MAFTAADEIHLSRSIFTALTKTGVLASTAFHVSATGTAADPLDRIIYDSTTGNLFYDPDGSGAAPGVQFARLEPTFTPTAADFVVIG